MMMTLMMVTRLMQKEYILSVMQIMMKMALIMKRKMKMYSPDLKLQSIRKFLKQ